MSFATDLFSGLTGFRDHLIAAVEEEAAPALAAVEGHLARLEPMVRSNVLAAEDEARAILHELYGSLAAEVKAEVSTPLPPAQVPEAAPVAEAEAAPVAADPTPAPGTTPEASSALSNEPSTSTDAPAAQ